MNALSVATSGITNGSGLAIASDGLFSIKTIVEFVEFWTLKAIALFPSLDVETLSSDLTAIALSASIGVSTANPSLSAVSTRPSITAIVISSI